MTFIGLYFSMPSGVVKIGNKKEVWSRASPPKTMVRGGKSRAIYLNVFNALGFLFFFFFNFIFQCHILKPFEGCTRRGGEGNCSGRPEGRLTMNNGTAKRGNCSSLALSHFSTAREVDPK